MGPYPTRARAGCRSSTPIRGTPRGRSGVPPLPLPPLVGPVPNTSSGASPQVNVDPTMGATPEPAADPTTPPTQSTESNNWSLVSEGLRSQPVSSLPETRGPPEVFGADSIQVFAEQLLERALNENQMITAAAHSAVTQRDAVIAEVQQQRVQAESVAQNLAGRTHLLERALTSNNQEAQQALQAHA